MPRSNKIGNVSVIIIGIEGKWCVISPKCRKLRQRPPTPVTCLDPDLKLDRDGDKYVCYQTRYPGPDIFLPIIYTYNFNATVQFKCL